MRHKRENFTGGCRDKTFALERMSMRHMEFNAELQKGCALELSGHCGKVNERKQLKCLTGAMTQPTFTAGCKKLVQASK